MKEIKVIYLKPLLIQYFLIYLVSLLTYFISLSISYNHHNYSFVNEVKNVASFLASPLIQIE